MLTLKSTSLDICIVRINLDYFETFSKDEICAINEAVVQNNTKKATNFGSQCLLAGRNDFHAEFDYTDR